VVVLRQEQQEFMQFSNSLCPWVTTKEIFTNKFGEYKDDVKALSHNPKPQYTQITLSQLQRLGAAPNTKSNFSLL